MFVIYFAAALLTQEMFFNLRGLQLNLRGVPLRGIDGRRLYCLDKKNTKVAIVRGYMFCEGRGTGAGTVNK